MSLQIIARVVARVTSEQATPKTASGMRECTEKEYLDAIAKAHWPEPRYMHTKRTMDKLYTDNGVEVAQKTEISTRGKKPQVLYLCNPDYLK
jgi:hypothetical protein